MAVPKFVPTRKPPMVLGARILGLDMTDEFKLADLITEGLGTDSVRSLARQLEITVKEALVATGIPESTFHARSSEGEPLSPEASSRVYRVAKAVESALDYFEGDKEAARRWLTHPKVGLGGRVPMEFARTPEGSDYVANLIGRMEHGIIS